MMITITRTCENDNNDDGDDDDDDDDDATLFNNHATLFA